MVKMQVDGQDFLPTTNMHHASRIQNLRQVCGISGYHMHKPAVL